MRSRLVYWALTVCVAALMCVWAGCERKEAPEMPGPEVRKERPSEERGPAPAASPEQAPAPKDSESVHPPDATAPDSPAPLRWHRPRFNERADERRLMVEKQIASRYDIPAPTVRDERVLEAMRQVPRHLFVPRRYLRAAYADQPLPIGLGQTISQPYIVALMTEQLDVQPGERVLEIGTGSGYQAAVLSELTPSVCTVEILDELAEKAAGRLKKLGYKTVRVRTGDGYDGWPQHGPFDGIIVTCAAGHVPVPLLQQLKPGGRIVIPIGHPYGIQRLTVVTRGKDGKLRTRDLLPVRFVPMTGRMEKEGK